MSTPKCEMCGREIPNAKNRQKFCPDCVKKRQAAQSHKSYLKHREYYLERSLAQAERRKQEALEELLLAKRPEPKYSITQVVEKAKTSVSATAGVRTCFRSEKSAWNERRALMTLITKSEELMAVSVRQGVELAAIEAKVLLGYLEGHDYSLMMDEKFHLALHDNQDGENADNDQPYTIRDCIDFCQEMNSELLLEEAGKEGGDPDYFSELQKDELILGMMMERAKVALPPRTSTYDVVIVEYLKKVVPVEAASWEEAKMLVNEAWDNGTYVLTADDFAGVSFTLGR